MKRHTGTTASEVGSIEAEYTASVSAEHRAKYGQFFTPDALGQAMATWVSAKAPALVLDPAVGTGALLVAAREVGYAGEMAGWDIDPGPLERAAGRFEDDEAVSLTTGDFLMSAVRDAAAITCNPPYVKHHNVSYPQEVTEPLLAELGMSGRTANLYVLFFGALMRALAPGGRAAILIPADWMNANFGEGLKRYLGRSGYVRRMAYFTSESSPFPDALTTAVIVFVEKTAKKGATEVVVIDGSFEGDVRRLGDARLGRVIKEYTHAVSLAGLDPQRKWDQPLRGVAADPVGIATKAMGACSRGIATGANKYFHLSDVTLISEGLTGTDKRATIGRARDVGGLIFTKADFDDLGVEVPRWLVDLDRAKPDDDRYLTKGEAAGLPQRFLLSARTPWWRQEARKPADIWVGVFGRAGVRFIQNRSAASGLTTFHGIHVRDKKRMTTARVGALVAILNSSRFQEMNAAHQRAYGGGLIKVEPRDVEEMTTIDVRELSAEAVATLGRALARADKLMRAGDVGWRIPLDRALERIEE